MKGTHPQVYQPLSGSFIDEHSLRALICAPLAKNEGPVELLYVDVPIYEHFQPGPEEMFALGRQRHIECEYCQLESIKEPKEVYNDA